MKLWNLSSGALLTSFSANGGEILRLTCTPPECSVSVVNWVMSEILSKREKFREHIHLNNQILFLKIGFERILVIVDSFTNSKLCSAEVQSVA